MLFYRWMGLRRDEAVLVLKRLLDSCVGLDGCGLELAPPSSLSANGAGYQIVVRGVLDGETKKQLDGVVAEFGLAYQVGTMWKTRRSINKEPDTIIIYKPKNKKAA
jgi:hypothetical protein